jgi:hypothetical protein
MRLRDTGMYKSPKCNRIPPKQVQNTASDLRGVEALSWSVSPPQHSRVSPL